MDYIATALIFQATAESNKSLTVLTKTMQSGERTPKAAFKVITDTGEILEITVKRQAIGLEGTAAKTPKTN